MPNFKSYNQDQPLLLPLNIKELIPEGDIVYVINTVVEHLNITSIYLHVDNDKGGCPAYHPKMMLKVLFYAYAEGISSARQIDRRLSSDVKFMYLSGMQTPDFRTISNFRKDNKEQLIELFVQVVKLCQELGLAKLGHVAIDGSKLRANAGRRNSRSEEKLEKMEEAINQQIQELLKESEKIDKEEDALYGNSNRGDEIPKELAKKEILKERVLQAKKLLEQRECKEINMTDPDSRFMKYADGGKNVSYNVQIAVDADHQIIVASDVSSEPTDQHQFIPMYEQVVENTGKKPDEVSADSGYDTNENYIYMEENNIDAYVPDQQSRKEIDKNGQEHIPEFDKRNFIFNEEQGSYVCPAGQQLHHRKTFEKNGVIYNIYESANCQKCEFKSKCTKSRQRQIIVSAADPVKAKMRKKLNSDDGKNHYFKRMYTVEPVFGYLKKVLRFACFQLRGGPKVKGEFSLMCIAYNIRKIYLSLKLEKLYELLNRILLKHQLCS